MKRLFIILILFSLCFAITKEVEVWHFTKVDGDEALAKWMLKQNEDLLCWDTSHLDETKKNKLKNLDFGEKDKTKTKKDFDKKGCINIEKNKKYKIGKNSVEFEYGNITLTVDLLYNQKYCFIDNDCIQKYKICSNATITNEVLNAYFLDLLQNKNITTDFEIYEMKLQNVSKIGYNTTEYECEVEEYDNETGMNITKNTTCYNTTEYTYITEELVKSQVEPYENCKEIYFNSKFYNTGHYDIIPSVYDTLFTEYDDVYVSYPYWVQDDNVSLWIKANVSAGNTTSFYVYMNWSNGTLSSCDNVFIFCDDFNNGFNSSKWIRVKGNVIDSSAATVENGSLYISAHPSDSTRRSVFSNQSYFLPANIINYTNIAAIWSMKGISTSSMNAYFQFSPCDISMLVAPEGYCQQITALIFLSGNSGNSEFQYMSTSDPREYFYASYLSLPHRFLLRANNMTNGYLATNKVRITANYTTNPNLFAVSNTLKDDPQTFRMWAFMYAGMPNSPLIIDYWFIKKDENSNITITCNDVEIGTYNINGGTATARRQCNITSNETLTDYQFEIPFSYFNDIKLYITNDPAYDGPIKPEILSISISPSIAYTTDDLNCTIQTRDNDSELINITFKWYNSSSLFYEYNLTSQNANGTYSSILLSNFTKKHENWTCVANITDGTNSDEKNISIYINNTVYNVSNLILSPNDVRTNSIVMCSAFYYDIDNDNGIGIMKWYINNTNTYNYSVNTTSNSSIISVYPYNIWHGDKITCELTISDGGSANTTISNFSYVILPSCNDYYEDSGLFDKITYGDEIYYIPKQTQPATYSCYNDKIQFIKIHNYPYNDNLESYHINDFIVHGRNSGGGMGGGTSITLKYYSPLAFANNKTLTISVDGTYCSNTKIRVANSTGSYFDMTSGSITFRSDNKIVGGSTIGASDNVFIITHYVDLGDGTFSECSYTICGTSKTYSNSWLCNASFAKRIDRSGIIPKIHLQGVTMDVNQNMIKKFDQTIYENISVFGYGRTDNVVVCPSWFCEGTITGKVIFIKKENASKMMLYPNDVTILPSNSKYYAYIVQNNEIVKPILMFYMSPNDFLDYYPFQYQYSPTTYKIPMVSNIGAIYLTEKGLCYFVPPSSPANLSIVYTLQAYYISCNASVTEYQILLQKLNLTSPQNATQSLFDSSSNTSKYGNEYIVFGILLVVAVILMLMNNSIVAMFGGAAITIFLIWLGVFSTQFGIVISLILVLLGSISLIVKR